MKYLRFHLLTLFAIFFIYSCNQEVIKEKGFVSPSISKTGDSALALGSFETDTTYAFEVDKPSTDTFKLVSSSWYFYYPFGNFSNPDELRSHFSNRFEIKEETSATQNVPLEKVTLYRLKMTNGFIKFFHTTQEEGSENNEMALVSAKITNPTIKMTNGLRVGLTRDEVKNILFNKVEPKGLRNYNNLMISTGLEGLWVHFNFKDDKLIKIIIDTDYLLNKD